MLHGLKKNAWYRTWGLLPREKNKSQKTSQEWEGMEAWKGVLYCFVCIMVCLGCMKKGLMSVLEMLTCLCGYETTCV